MKKLSKTEAESLFEDLLQRLKDNLDDNDIVLKSDDLELDDIDNIILVSFEETFKEYSLL